MKRLISAAFVVLAVLMLSAAPALANHSDDRNCDDFDSRQQAQDFFNRHGGSRTTNVDGLDRDSNGQACETHDYASGNGDGGGGGGGGDGDNGGGGGGGDGNNDGNGGGSGGGGMELPPTATGVADPSTTPVPWLLTALGIGTFGLLVRRRIGVRL